MSVTQESPAAPAVKSRLPLVGGALALATLLVLGGVGGAKLLGKQRHGRAAAALASEQSPVAASGPEITPLGAAQRYELGIVPENAEVTIDGNRVDVKNGKVEITGTLGETRSVKVSVGGKTREQTVAVSQNGLVPDRIEVTLGPKAEARAAKGAKSEPLEPSAQKPKEEPATKPKVPAPTEKPKPKVETSQDEFNK